MLFRFENRLVVLFSLIALSFVLSGCEEKAAPPPQPARPPAVKKKAAPPPRKEEVKREVKKEVRYFYDPSGKKDPFLPFIAVAPVVEEEEVEEEVPLTELQTYELSQLKLVAVMNIGGKGVAMVEDPAGKGHTLRVGTLIGKNRGKVVAIEEGNVLVEEKYRDILGEIKSSIKELVIEAPEGGKR